MAKQEIGRASKAGVDSSDLKQQDVAQLLKKKVVEQQADDAAVAKDAAAAETVMVASADSVFASDAPVMVAAAGDTGGLFGGASTGTVVAVGAAVIGGGILIANASDDNNDNGASPGGGGGGPGTGGDITLTANDETVGSDVTDEDFKISTDGTDTVHGIVDPTAGADLNDETTFSNGDIINGNGKTIVQLDVDSGGFADVVEINDVAAINLIAQTTGVTVTFFAGSWENVGEVAYIGGAGGLGVLLTSADVGLDMSIADNVNGGGIAASYTNDLLVNVFNSGKGGASIINDANNVPDLTVDVANGNSGSMWFTGTANGDVEVGDMTGVAGDTASLTAFNSVTNTGNVTVGNVSLTLGDNASAGANFSASGDLTIGDVSIEMGDSGTAVVNLSATGDLSYGDISIVGGDQSSTTLAQTVSLFASGNITGGDVSIEIGNAVATASPTVELFFTAFASGDLSIGNVTLSEGDVSATSGFTFDGLQNISISASGDVVVGDISMTVGDLTLTDTSSASGTGILDLDVQAALAGNGGNLTVGNVSMVGGNNIYVSASLDFSGSSATDLTVGDVTLTVGDVVPTTLGAAGPGFAGAFLSITNSNALAGADLTVGDVNVTGGISADFSGYIFLTALTGTSLTGDLGDLTVGNISINLGRDALNLAETASAYLEIGQYGSASTSLDQGMGALTVGDIDVTLGQDAFFSLTVTQNLDGSAVSATMGDFTVGGLTASLDKGAYMFYALYASNTATYTAGSGGNLGAVSVGDVAVSLDDGASFSAFYSFTATSGDVGSVTIGNFDADLGVGATLGSYSVNISGQNVGDVVIGDISVFVGQNALATSMLIDVDATSGTIESFTLGDISFTLDTSGSLNDFSVDVDATGDINEINLGNLSILAQSSAVMSASPTFNFSGHDLGPITVGNVSIVAHTVGDAMDAYYNFVASGDIDSFTMGDVTLSADGDPNSTVSVTIDLSATTDKIGDINVGNVLLSYTSGRTGGDIHFSIDQTAVTSGDITIGGITLDYTAVGTTGAAALTEYYTFGVYAGTGHVHIDLVEVDIKISSSNTASSTTELTNHLNLSNILTSVSGATESLGTVDYSGVVYAGQLANPTLTIDLLTGNGGGSWTGDITVIGSDLNDVIVANDTGVMTFTGGDGDDYFNFGNGNGFLVEAKVSTVTDFEHNEDQLAIDAVAVTTNEMGTGTYASFAAFLADADIRFDDAVPEDVILGQIGTSVFVIVDANDDDNLTTADVIVELANASISTLDFGDFDFI